MTDAYKRIQEAPIVTARARCCGNLIYASVDLPEHWDAESKKELADLVLAGYEMGRVTAAEANENRNLWKWGCKCKKKAA